jgi:hypothetical protein
MDAPPVVRIEHHEMSFNAAALALLGNPSHLVLGWDDSRRTIHLTPLDHYATGAIKVERLPRTGRITCRGFLRFAGLAPWRAQQKHSPVLPVVVAPDGTLTVLLPPHETGATPREENTTDDVA